MPSVRHVASTVLDQQLADDEEEIELSEDIETDYENSQEMPSHERKMKLKEWIHDMQQIESGDELDEQTSETVSKPKRKRKKR